MQSASETEVGAFFNNSKSVEPIKITHEEIGHPQQATQMHIESSTTEGISKDNMQKK